jgi:hypothetical protein
MEIEEKRFKDIVAERFGVNLIHVFWDGLHYGQFKFTRPVERSALAQVYELAFKMGVLAPTYM